MNESQSTPAGPATDPAPTDAPDPTNAPDPKAAVNAEPNAEPDTSEDTLADQVARTDAALMAWREEAERRREAWEVARAKAEAEMMKQRRKVIRFGVLAGMAGLALGFVAGLSVYQFNRPPETPLPAPTVATATPDDPAAAAATEGASGAASEASSAAPATPGAASERSPGGGSVLPAVSVIPDSPRVWREGDHTWAGFSTTQGGRITLQWRDAAGNEVLEAMDCQGADREGIRHCAAGRSSVRLERALSAGAAPGTWTVQACSVRGCTEIGSFAVQ